ncbi:MAG: caspase family protein [Bacteroidota bacterium]
MKPIRVFATLLLAGLTAARGQVTTFDSKEIILKVERDKTIPILTIVEPRSTPGLPIVVSKDKCIVRGSTSDPAGIKAVLVNGVSVSIGKDGAFEVELALHAGVNPVIVTSQDNEGNKAERSLQFIRDVTPPVIEILEPKLVETRGIRHIETLTLTLKGRVTDEYGIRTVSVNDTIVRLSLDSVFTTVLPVRAEESAAIIVAVDNAGNIARREFVLPRRRAGGTFDYTAARNYAFIVGIDDYHGVWEKLKNAVRDAKAVESLFRNSFRFERIVTLYNEQATRDNILEKFDEFANTLTREDNLVVYYSGHGVLQERSQRGFWVPVDAEGRSTARYISHSDLKDRIAGFQVHHLLVVADACFSGELLRGTMLPAASPSSPEYLTKVFQPLSRSALTSGGVEPVVDEGKDSHSVFAYYFLKAMRDIDAECFSTSQVYERLKVAVGLNAPQTPQYKEIRDVGSESGEFVFVRK